MRVLTVELSDWEKWSYSMAANRGLRNDGRLGRLRLRDGVLRECMIKCEKCGYWTTNIDGRLLGKGRGLFRVHVDRHGYVRLRDHEPERTTFKEE